MIKSKNSTPSSNKQSHSYQILLDSNNPKEAHLWEILDTNKAQDIKDNLEEGCNHTKTTILLECQEVPFSHHQIISLVGSSDF